MSIGNNSTCTGILKLWMNIADILNGNIHISSGQGIVYNSLSAYFYKDRIKSDYSKKCIMKMITIITNIFFRKTTKSLKSPVRYHGWKGKR